jgi:hypothetical protein
MSEENDAEDGSVSAEVSPKIISRRQSVDDELNVESQVGDSTAVRKVSLPSGGLSFKTNDVVKKRVRGDIRAMLA